MSNVNKGEGKPRLPEFTDVISIEVEINAIYKKLIATFPADYQHKELLSHAIVGSASKNGGIGYIYNALNGYTNDVDFEVGDIIICTDKDRREYYDANRFDSDGTKKNVPVVAREEGAPVVEYKPRWDYRWVEVGKCEILEIDMYREKKLKVRFQSEVSQGKFEDKEEWVNHRKCTMKHSGSRELVEAVAH